MQELNLSARLSLGGFRIYPKSTPLVAGFQSEGRDYSLHSTVGTSRVEATVCTLQSAFYSRHYESRDYSLHSSVGISRVVTSVCILQSALYSLCLLYTSDAADE